MRIHDIRKPKGIKRSKKRVGRGAGSGYGKTSGRGHKGAKSRTGASRRLGFEGGQMSLIRRLPKRGFTSVNKRTFQIVNIEDLNHFRKDSAVDKKALKADGFIRSSERPVKILGEGKLSKALSVSADAFSESAKKKIAEAGGSAKKC